MKLIGKCSEFGGTDDDGMVNDTGLALYEAGEADRRPDLFIPGPITECTWRRLKADACFIALRFDHKVPRWLLQTERFIIWKESGGVGIPAALVDWGPSRDTRRVVDCSKALLEKLGAGTDDVLVVQSDLMWF